MAEIDVLEDPVWEFVLNSKLAPYIERVREFWKHIDDVQVTGTGVYSIPDGPPGLMYRVTNTPVRSPIKHVQVFPFVPVAYLQLTNVPGGANRMVCRVCYDNKFTIDEFTIIEKSNLPSTYHQGQFVAFVPTDILNGVKHLGKWVYMTTPEMLALLKDKIPESVKQKLIKYV